MTTLTVAGSPQSKQRARTVTRYGKTRTYTPRETFDFEWKVSRVARRLGKPEHGGTMAYRAEPLFIQARFIFKRPQRLKLSRKAPDGLILRPCRPDKDNLEKAISDGIEKAGNVYVDDAQLVGGEGWKFYAERDGKPRTEIVIYRIVEDAPAVD
jgi:Holliday junction resolvase RusA-like endonuclease